MTQHDVDDRPRTGTATRVPNTLMLLSAHASPQLRRSVAAGERPCPEFLRLEAVHGLKLLDWAALRRDGGHRSVGRSLRHVAAALPQLASSDAVFSDGEHVGIPLAWAMRLTGRRIPHLVIGHHLASPAKRRLFRWARAHRSIDRILVHSANQVEVLTRGLRIPESLIEVVPYAVDVDYWSPREIAEEDDLIVASGREHRDYACLAEACPSTARLFITDSSPHSPNAARTAPTTWPPNVERRGLPLPELRELYARATIIVVPVVRTASPFGVTSLLEAMAMGKAIIVSDTDGLHGLVDDGVTALRVPPGDVSALRAAIDSLLADPARRERMGRAARAAAVERFGLDGYVAELARHLREITPDRGLVST